MNSSLYIGASGLRSYGEGMSVVSNNLANLNTVGFKQSMMMYQDLISRTETCTANYYTGLAQSGAGVANATVRTLFTDGGLELTTTSTDLAINGIGYFGVQNNGETLYTRAGNFRFTKEGDLVDPSGYNLLGHSLRGGIEDPAVTPIRLDMTPGSWVSLMPAKPTSEVQVISNLGGITDVSSDPANPFFSMAAKWNGGQNPPLTDKAYSFQESFEVYDPSGNKHDLALYYDLAGEADGILTYEYILGANPEETSVYGDKNAGMFLKGTMSFNSMGQIIGMTAFNPDDSQAAINNGFPAFTANFAGAASQQVNLDIGFKLEQGWNPNITSPSAGVGPNTIDFFLPTPGAVRSSSSMTAYGGTYSNLVHRQNGYPEGELSNIVVSADGVISGRYSNSQTQDLYQLNLYRFTSQDGLKREGGNHFSVTDASGPAQEGRPGKENFGIIHSSTIEQSNVDMAREFTTMIITQRAFQMNSKVVTTSDQMLQKALELKR